MYNIMQIMIIMHIVMSVVMTYDSRVLQTVDPKFDELEQKLTSLEMLLRQLIRDVTTWQEDLQVCACIVSYLTQLQTVPPSLPSVSLPSVSLLAAESGGLP